MYLVEASLLAADTADSYVKIVGSITLILTPITALLVVVFKFQQWRQEKRISASEKIYERQDKTIEKQDERIQLLEDKLEDCNRRLEILIGQLRENNIQPHPDALRSAV